MWNMGKCINGDADNPNLLEADIDLGRSINHKSKLPVNRPKDFDPNKIFGVPSIRYDLTKKKIPSVQNIKVKLFIFLTNILELWR